MTRTQQAQQGDEATQIANQIENDSAGPGRSATDDAAADDGENAAKRAVAHGIADKVADKLEKDGYMEAAGMVRAYKTPNGEEGLFDDDALAELFAELDENDELDE